MRYRVHDCRDVTRFSVSVSVPARLSELERELSTIQLEQRQLQQQLGQNERELSELQARYEGCVCRRQQLEGGIKRASARLQRCTRLTTVLADEDSRWSAKIKVRRVPRPGWVAAKKSKG